MIVPLRVTELLSSMAAAFDVNVAVHSPAIDGGEEKVTKARISVFNIFTWFVNHLLLFNYRFKRLKSCDKSAGFVVNVFVLLFWLSLLTDFDCSVMLYCMISAI